MVVGQPTTATRVKPGNEGRHISNEAIIGGWDWCRGTSNSGSGDGGNRGDGNDNWYVVMVCLQELYRRNVFLRSSGGRLRRSRAGTGNSGSGSNENGGQ